jgi:hypothetical protein
MTLGFPDREAIADLTAKMFLEVEAVRFMTDKPFIFTSGWASPVYTDCRRLISFPRVRRTLMDFGASIVHWLGAEKTPDTLYLWIKMALFIVDRH